MSKLKKNNSGGNLESIKIKLKTLKNNCKYQKLLSDNSANNNKVFKLYKIIKSLLNNDKLNKDEKLNLNDLDDIKDNIFENLSKKQIISLLNKIEKIIKYNEITGGHGDGDVPPPPAPLPPPAPPPPPPTTATTTTTTPHVADDGDGVKVKDGDGVKVKDGADSTGNADSTGDAGPVRRRKKIPNYLPVTPNDVFDLSDSDDSLDDASTPHVANSDDKELALKMLYLYIDAIKLINNYNEKTYKELKKNIKSKIYKKDKKNHKKISLLEININSDDKQKIKWKILGAYFLFLTKIADDTELSSDIKNLLLNHSIDEKDIRKIEKYTGNFITTELKKKHTELNKKPTESENLDEGIYKYGGYYIHTDIKNIFENFNNSKADTTYIVDPAGLKYMVINNLIHNTKKEGGMEGYKKYNKNIYYKRFGGAGGFSNILYTTLQEMESFESPQHTIPCDEVKNKFISFIKNIEKKKIVEEKKYTVEECNEIMNKYYNSIKSGNSRYHDHPINIFKYGKYNIIHAIGPDFNNMNDNSVLKMNEYLTFLYKNIILEYLEHSYNIVKKLKTEEDKPVYFNKKYYLNFPVISGALFATENLREYHDGDGIKYNKVIVDTVAILKKVLQDIKIYLHTEIVQYKDYSNIGFSDVEINKYIHLYKYKILLTTDISFYLKKDKNYDYDSTLRKIKKIYNNELKKITKIENDEDLKIETDETVKKTIDKFKEEKKDVEQAAPEKKNRRSSTSRSRSKRTRRSSSRSRSKKKSRSKSKNRRSSSSRRRKKANEEEEGPKGAGIKSAKEALTEAKKELNNAKKKLKELNIELQNDNLFYEGRKKNLDLQQKKK